MSAKQVRKLQALKVSKKSNEDSEDSEGSGSNREPTKESKACGFAALVGSDSEPESDSKPAELETAAERERQEVSQVAQEVAQGKDGKGKKKKKGKKGRGPKKNDSEGEEMLLEAALAQAEVAAAANSPGQGDEVTGNSLAMAKAFFSADRERRRLFKVKPSQTREPTRKGQGLKVRGTNEGHFLHYRRLFLVEPTPDEGWPRPDGCARMVVDSQCFRVETTPEHSKILTEFASAVSFDPQMLHDFLDVNPFCVEALIVASEMNRQGREHQEAFQILRRAVYAAECGFNGSFSPFLETQVPMLRGEVSCFVSWPRVRVQLDEAPSWPGWSWLMALWAYMLGLANQGLPRTSLEICKLLLAMTLPDDPTHSLVHLDYFALRAEEYDFLLQFVENFNPPCSLPDQSILRLDCCLPNFAYSAALACYLRIANTSDADDDDASALRTVNVEHLTEPCWVKPTRAGSDSLDGPSKPHLALLRAMLFFPGTLRSILDKLGISLNCSASGSPYKLSWSELMDRSPFGPKQTLHQQHFLAHALVSDAFVQRCATFFRGERMFRWLHACAGRLVQMCESSVFEEELLATRKAWSEKPLAVTSALAKDYKSFSPSEVGPERKVPVILERAVNSWFGPPTGTVPGANVPPAGYALGPPLRPPLEVPPGLETQQHEEAQAEAAERRRLVEEQDAEYLESLAADAARSGRSAENLAQLEAMGFDSAAAADALHKAGGNVEAAVELLTNE